MKPIILSLIAGLAPIPVLYLFYYRYFSLKKSLLSHLEYFAYGVLLASVIFILSPVLAGMLRVQAGAASVFIRAAGVEKLGAFILILVLVLRERKNFTVADAVVSAMLLGLGFAAIYPTTLAIVGGRFAALTGTAFSVGYMKALLERVNAEAARRSTL